MRRKERWSLPPVAAIINAVVHADYAQRGAPPRVSIFDDCLDVENPGLLPFGLTVEDLPRGVSKLRNHVIGRVFHALGLIEQWGSGTQRMTSACREAGLAAPLFEELATRFRMTNRYRASRPSPSMAAWCSSTQKGAVSSTRELRLNRQHGPAHRWEDAFK